jgi:hypothetical protein
VGKTQRNTTERCTVVIVDNEVQDMVNAADIVDAHVICSIWLI